MVVRHLAKPYKTNGKLMIPMALFDKMHLLASLLMQISQSTKGGQKLEPKGFSEIPSKSSVETLGNLSVEEK